MIQQVSGSLLTEHMCTETHQSAKEAVPWHGTYLLLLSPVVPRPGHAGLYVLFSITSPLRL